MFTKRSALVLASAGLLVPLMARSLTATSQPATPPAGDVTAALLAEVHELRLAMERSATVAPRVQLTLARLNIEEQRTHILSGQLEQIRQEQANTSLAIKKLSSDLDDVQKALLSETNERERRGLQGEESRLHRMLEEQATIEGRLRVRDNDTAQALGAEQSRWIELNAKLDELERVLAPIQ
jgi:hypothetical protein